MRLVEKKCPNCGGELKFGFEDKETKCEFCGTSFEIERDEKKLEDNNEKFNADNYALTEEQKKAATAIVGTFAAMQVLPIIVGAVIIIMFVGFGILAARHNNNFSVDRKEVIEEKINDGESKDQTPEKTAKERLKEEGYIFSFKELTGDNLNDFHDNSTSILKNEINRYNAFLYGHGNWSYVGMYLLTNDYGNSIYDVFSINFKINGKAIPYFSAVKYDNVRVKEGKLKVNMKGYVVGALNSNSGMNSKDTFGYASAKDFYNKVIRGESVKSDVSIIGDVYNE